MLAVFFDLYLQGLLNLELAHLANLASHFASEIHLCLPNVGITGGPSCPPCIYIGSGDLNSSSYVHGKHFIHQAISLAQLSSFKTKTRIYQFQIKECLGDIQVRSTLIYITPLKLRKSLLLYSHCPIEKAVFVQVTCVFSVLTDTPPSRFTASRQPSSPLQP